MAIALDEILKTFTPEDRALVEAEAQELIEEALTLRDLRRANQLTQTALAQAMGLTQEGVSRLEHRADLLLSTLSSYVTAMGGTFRLIAEFPDRKPVTVALQDITEPALPTSRTREAKGLRGRIKRSAASRLRRSKTARREVRGPDAQRTRLSQTSRAKMPVPVSEEAFELVKTE